MPQRYQRPYPPEFRREAVSLVKATGRSIKAVAGELGVSTESLRKRVSMASMLPRTPHGRNWPDTPVVREREQPPRARRARTAISRRRWSSPFGPNRICAGSSVRRNYAVGQAPKGEHWCVSVASERGKRSLRLFSDKQADQVSA